MIHSTALIDEGASIHPTTTIWHWTHVCSGAVIGAECRLGQNIFVGNKVLIGDRVKIQNNVSVYDEVIIEDDVFCGPSMVFTNVYNPRAFIERKNEYRKTHVKRGASIGANATIICGVEIGQYAFIGAGAVVRNDIKDFSLTVGVPARHIAWVSRYGERLALPLKGSGIEATCEHTGEKYILDNDQCYLIGSLGND